MELETFFSVSEQTSQFLLSAALGAVMGVIYDVFRVIRIVFPQAKKQSCVCAADILFSLVCAALFFLFCYVFCGSQIRLYCLLGVFLGFVLYIETVGEVVTGIFKAVTKACWFVLRKVYFTAFEPIVKLIRLICQKTGRGFVHTYEKVKFFKISCDMGLKKDDEMVYNKETKLG